MLTRVLWLFGCFSLIFSNALSAQDPLSAIDWLSDSLAAPVSLPSGTAEHGAVRSALPEDVSVSDIDAPSLDGVGLLPISVTGLPRDLWGRSRSAELAGRFQFDQMDMLPAMQELLYTLLLAELDPPLDTGHGSVLFLARLDSLLALGALEKARSLLELSGQNKPALFRRAFDVSMLMHTEDEACEVLRTTPALSPTFPARVFCLARGGDWDAAALSLETGRALGFLTEFEDALLARFLDPILFEGDPAPRVEGHPSPLVFRMMGAIGEPLPTANLPRAFAYADLNTNSGWKAQIEAAERLVKSGALDPNRLVGLYSERRPAASGGVWDRVSAIQALDKALKFRDVTAISQALPMVWEVMALGELEVPFARIFAHRLEGIELNTDIQELVLNISLLAVSYENAALTFDAKSDRQKLLVAIAQGQPGDVFSADPTSAAIQDGFRAKGIPVRLQSLTNNHRMGEAILRAIALFANGANGDLDELTDALAFFRAIGLEDVARQASLQLLLLDRRG